MSDHATDIAEQGFTVLDDVLDDALIDRTRRAIGSVWEGLGRPSLFCQQDIVHADDVHVSPVGLTISGILGRAPELADLLLEPRILAVLEAVLGPGFELEQMCGVMSDDARPFFFWHHHVGGIDGADHRGRPYPVFERCERLVVTLYATPLDDEHGTMLVSPRRAAGPTTPPHTPGREPWPGATTLRVNAGSVVVLDQGTWHAVTPMRSKGHRFFAAFFVRRNGHPLPRREDRTLAAAMQADPRLADAYRRGEAARP